MNGYRTIAHESEIEIVIKKSRFIGYAFLVSSAEEANEKLAALRKRQWDASHHCSAYVLGADKQLQKYSDDGEPQGTAGMPILQVLHHKDVTNTILAACCWGPAVWCVHTAKRPPRRWMRPGCVNMSQWSAGGLP